MRSFLLTLFILALATRAEETEVLVLTNENFDDIIKDNEFVLVKFYAPWCGHCKALAPEYDSASLKLKESGSKIKLAKVDATVENNLASKFSVQGYPTLKFFISGNPVEYNGGRKAEDIIAWVTKKSGPPLVPVNSKDDIEKAKKEHQVVGILVASDKSSDIYKTLEKVATINDAIPILYVDAVNKADGLKDNTFTLFKQFDEPKVEFSGKTLVEDVNSFIKKERIPLVSEFSQETSQAIFESETKVHLLAFSSKENEADFKKHWDILKIVAKKFIGKMHVIILDMKNSESMRVAEYFSIKKESVPAYVVLNLEKNMVKFFPEKQVFEANDIMEFVQNVFDNKIKPFLKSQEEPADWDKEPVKVLVANKFEERAVSKDKSVFVEFYAPWCGHCKALTPIWDELATKFKDNSDIVIAKMDATENELEKIAIQSFPTLKYSPKGSTEFIDYKGGRTLEALEKFVNSDGKTQDADDEEGHDEL